MIATTPDKYKQVLNEICRYVIAPEAVAIDENCSFPTKSISALKNTGLLGAVSSVDVGGLNIGARGAAVIVERIAMECGSTAMVVCMHFCGTAVLEKYADNAVRREAARGDHLSTLAFSEAGSRSLFWMPVSTAEPKDGNVTLNAHKSWVTSASHATGYIWSSRPLKADGRSTLWLVPSNSAGLSVAGPFDGLGLKGNDSSPVRAQDVSIPLSAKLGEDGKGFDVMLSTVLPCFNVLTAACSLGMMEAAVTRTAEHASRTKLEPTGSTLSDLPTIRNYIGRIRVNTDSVRALLEDTLNAIENGRPDTMMRVLECKAAAGETATQVLDIAMRVCGGAAFRKETGIERYFRDTRAISVMGPTTDVLYDFVGKAACGLELF
jgi:alkylation response protein AidB-like acyl-CoA dehydrogenase